MIRNREIKKELTEYYRNIKFYKELEVEFHGYNLGYRRLVGDILSPKLRMSLKGIGVGGPYKREIEDKPSIESLIFDLKKLNGLNGYLVDIERVRGVSVRSTHQLILKMNAIINKIKNGNINHTG